MDRGRQCRINITDVLKTKRKRLCKKRQKDRSTVPDKGRGRVRTYRKRQR